MMRINEQRKKFKMLYTKLIANNALKNTLEKQNGNKDNGLKIIKAMLEDLTKIHKFISMFPKQVTKCLGMKFKF